MNRNVRDAIRILLMMAIATGLLYASRLKLPESALSPLLTSSSIVLYLVTFNHIVRRILLPYIDLRTWLEEAKKGNMAAAVVVCGVFYVLIS